MPELPDLQVYSLNINRQLAGKTLQNLTVQNSPKVNASEKALQELLTGQQLDEIYREGKELRLKFGNGHRLGLHLMLHGKLFFFEKENLQKHAIIQLYFADNIGLVLTDYQGLATVTLDPAEKNVPDALGEEMNAPYLEKQLQQKRTTIKNLLLDQKVIRGIGNAYADEILWDAKLSPFSICNKISNEKIKALTVSIKSVLMDAEKQILESHPQLINGEVRDFLKIHNHKKKESPTGAVVIVGNINSRKTYYTEEQELFT
ncbi:MAG: Fpg/Nei family DNA glycosylase [Sphingobacteriaceae bacterium]